MQPMRPVLNHIDTTSVQMAVGTDGWRPRSAVLDDNSGLGGGGGRPRWWGREAEAGRSRFMCDMPSCIQWAMVVAIGVQMGVGTDGRAERPAWLMGGSHGQL